MASANSMCFTVNNYTDDDWNTDFSKWKCSYFICGREIGEEGTPHLQGYVEWNSSKNFTTVHKLFKGRGHWEKRKGTPEEASEYCKKDGNFKEIGKLSEQGKRSDLDEIGQMIIEKTPLIEIAKKHPGDFIRYNKGFIALKNTLSEDRKTKPKVFWLWGTSGVGKTYTATHNHSTYYIKDGTMWWDNYDQEEAIIIDDFDGKWPFRDLLRLLDHNKYQGQYKGGYVKINSPYIYITCEFPPSHFWQNNELLQVTRRIDGGITQLKNEQSPPWIIPEKRQMSNGRSDGVILGPSQKNNISKKSEKPEKGFGYRDEFS